MKRTILITLFALFAFAGFSFADTVDYNTSQSLFFCSPVAGLAGCGSAQLIVGDTSGLQNANAIVITYVATSISQLNATPNSFTNLGHILVSCYNGGTACGSQTLSGLGIGLSLVLAQTDVSLSGETFTGALATAALSGTISGSSGFGLIVWNSGNSVTSTGPLYNVNYSVVNNTLGLVVPASDNCSPCSVVGPAGDTTIQGLISITALVQTPPPGPQSPIPEPASLLLVASGLVGTGLVRRRK